MPEFQHLPLFQVIERKTYNPQRGGSEKSDQVIYNLEHRQQHFDNLTDQIDTVRSSWQATLADRKEKNLPPLAAENVIPVFLQLDLAKDLESLKSFGIEIISEEEDGYIIGANSDNFRLAANRLEQFLNESSSKFKDSAASILKIISDPSERLKRVLSSGLISRWDSIQDEAEVTVYIAISCYVRTPGYPTKGPDQTEERYQQAVARWKERDRTWQTAQDNLAREREDGFERIINQYNAEFVSNVSRYAEFDDGFGCKIRISGAGLKDLALNYPYIFNIEEHDPLLSFQGTEELQNLLELEIVAPLDDAPTVCVIDSGIQEGHRLLAPAIDDTLSISYVPGDNDTFDKVNGGGHGTRVAGSVLFPNGFASTPPNIQASCWIQNARILNDQNLLSSLINEPEVMKLIVDRFYPTRIFNLSVSRQKPEVYIHMPIWAATIDKLIWEKDIIFCIAAGNIPKDSRDPNIPGIQNYIVQGNNYPDFLVDDKAKITAPAHSCLALTVGSISDTDFQDNDLKCIANKDLPSSFSRSGLGLWGMIKPDVVEYGGDMVIDKATNSIVNSNPQTSPNLIRSTRDNGPAVGREVVGTSFTTPKVTHVIAALQQLYPDESCLLYRALVVQSARIPLAAQNIPNFIKHFGYGIPDLNRATNNSSRRVTLYNSGKVNPRHADIYLIKIPQEINRPGYDFDVLVEVTLSYKAAPRITRRKTKSYLSCWLDWEVSRMDENLESFKERILSVLEEDDNNDVNEQVENAVEIAEVAAGQQNNSPFNWSIGAKGTDGKIKGVKRQDSTVQKDWCIQKSNQLPSEFMVAVRGHKGWEKDLDKEIPYSIVVSFEILSAEININIYEEIRIANEVEVQNEVQLQAL
ncbi:S8 family peptidase [Chitinophaga ginsengisoli]|uniref:Subtilase family protein n=1 Tax=Chitinophaga ginsengisoli TaxID=363837 RepID=A0A2P8FUI4_9BACT|nr:S8 family peptidase [Chitinophaga ginsengisoli]PSL25382.1 subtilase family protein [Chitinophaga ginsengisoli]